MEGSKASREVRTINGVDYIFYNTPPLMQQIGRQEYKDRVVPNVGYLADPAMYVGNMPYVPCFRMVSNPRRHIPPMTCTRGGTLVVGGFAVWSTGFDEKDRRYAQQVLPTKEQVQEALAKAQGLHWGQSHQQAKGSVLEDVVVDLLCRSIAP